MHVPSGAELAETIARRRARMVSAAFRVLHGEDDAEDAVQDACLQALLHLDRFDGRAQLSTWLHRVVVNAALMRRRARQRRPIETMDVDTVADETTNIEAAVHRREVFALVRRALAEVPAGHRAVLVLRDLQQRDPVDVARTLRVTRGALKVRAHRARQAIRGRLAALGLDRARRAARSNRVRVMP